MSIHSYCFPPPDQIANPILKQVSPRFLLALPLLCHCNRPFCTLTTKCCFSFGKRGGGCIAQKSFLCQSSDGDFLKIDLDDKF